jgi:hypothetical protein
MLQVGMLVAVHCQDCRRLTARLVPTLLAPATGVEIKNQRNEPVLENPSTISRSGAPQSQTALNKKSSCSVASDVQNTQSPQPTELLMHCPQVEQGRQVQAL